MRKEKEKEKVLNLETEMFKRSKFQRSIYKRFCLNKIIESLKISIERRRKKDKFLQRQNFKRDTIMIYLNFYILFLFYFIFWTIKRHVITVT